jgi:hypothetical protein
MACIVGVPRKNLSSAKLLIPHLHLHTIQGRRVNQMIAIKWGIQHQALERFHTRQPCSLTQSGNPGRRDR